MRHALTTAVALMLIAGAAGRGSASSVAYTSSSDFMSAIAGYQSSVEDYSTLTAGTTINAGDTVDGITYSAFHSGPLGTLQGGIITNQFNSFSGQSLGGNQSGGSQYFFGGDSVTVDFAQPINAFGIFFNVNANSGTFGFTTAAGDASTGSASFDTSTFVFAGLVSDTPFSSVTFGSNDTSVGSFNIPEIISAAVPEPSSLVLTCVGLAALAGGRLRRRLRPAA